MVVMSLMLTFGMFIVALLPYIDERGVDLSHQAARREPGPRRQWLREASDYFAQYPLLRAHLPHYLRFLFVEGKYRILMGDQAVAGKNLHQLEVSRNLIGHLEFVDYFIKQLRGMMSEKK